MTFVELLELLRATRNETLAHFELNATALSRTYGPGKWNVHRILHHVADAEVVLCQRMSRVISGETSVKGFDQDAWCVALDYDHEPLHLRKAVYAAVRELNIHLIKKHVEKEGHRTFVHSAYGERTLKQEMEKVALHNRKHLDQIAAALEGKVWMNPEN